MSVFTLKLKNKSDNVVFNSIAGGYSHIIWVRTENPEDPVIRVFTTPDFELETRDILAAISEEVDFEFVGTEPGK